MGTISAIGGSDAFSLTCIVRKEDLAETVSKITFQLVSIDISLKMYTGC